MIYVTYGRINKTENKKYWTNHGYTDTQKFVLTQPLKITNIIQVYKQIK